MSTPSPTSTSSAARRVRSPLSANSSFTNAGVKASFGNGKRGATSKGRKKYVMSDEEEEEGEENERDNGGDEFVQPSSSSRNVSHSNSERGLATKGQHSSSAFKRVPPGVPSRSRVPSATTFSRSDGVSAPNSSSSDAMPQSGTSQGTTVSSVTGSSRSGVSVLARANGPRRSLGASVNAAAAGAVAQHEREAREVVKLNVDSTSFDEWMKMATDNKINASNTWGFALIDYFHDMSLLRSETGDGSINFQKASCTLDGCVKVWTSRVDSVVVETGKLLSGLQDEGNADDSKKKGKSGREGDEDADDQSLNADEDGAPNGNGKKSKRSKAKEATLGKNFSQIAIKKYDLEFSVDPLFKKTSADFDEGGAGGLLMNHLGVDAKARVVFDAGDVAGVGADGDSASRMDVSASDEGCDESADPEPHTTEGGDENKERIELSRLRSKLFEQHEVQSFEEGSEEPLTSLLSHLAICPTFSTFRFSTDDTSTFADLMGATTDDGNVELGLGMDDFGGDDFNVGGFDDAIGHAFGGDAEPMSDPLGMEGGPGLYGEGKEYDQGIDYGEGDVVASGSQDEPFGGIMPNSHGRGAPGRPQDLTMALQGIRGIGQAGDDDYGGEGNNFFDYFDQRLMKNWAGPEHWKMRNPASGLGSVAAQGQRRDEGTQVGEKPTRKVKEAFVIDFSSEHGAVASKELFEPAKGGGGTLLPAAKSAQQEGELHLLPEDRHFSSRQLLKLFIKPRAVLNIRRRGGRLGQLDADDSGMQATDVDEQFWMQAAASREGQGGNNGGLDVEFDEAGDPLPFGAHFMDDMGGFDNDEMMMPNGTDGATGMDADAEAEDDELATQALKRIRPEYVNFAKKAKKVDVKKLKETIWSELGIANALRSESERESEMETEEDEEGPQTPKTGRVVSSSSSLSITSSSAELKSTDPRTFNDILAGLRKSYAKDQMEEISTSFCFICLLHLANEEGLQLSTGGILDQSASASDRSLSRSTSNASSSSSSSLSLGGIVETDEDDDALGDVERGEDAKGEEKVGQLERMLIAKDPKAGRSA